MLSSDTADIHGVHMSCYCKFTAVSKIQRGNNNDVSNQRDQPTRIIRSNLTWPATSSSIGIFPKVFLFCNKERKQNKRKGANINQRTNSLF